MLALNFFFSFFLLIMVHMLFFYQLWYMLSKTLAEKATWKFAEENGIDMVRIHPGMVCGPLLQPTLNTSVEPILNLIGGTFKPWFMFKLFFLPIINESDPRKRYINCRLYSLLIFQT